jgi:hypothetical protein
MILTTITMAAVGLFAGLHASVIPLDAPTKGIDAREASAGDFKLEARANAIFTIGGAICGSGATVSQTIFPWPGQINVGCSEFNSAEQFDESLKSSAFSMTVCGTKTNFYRKDGNYDFYKNNGDGTLLGTCYPYSGPNRSCLVPLGSCGMSSKMRCYYSGKGKKLCN